MGCGCAACRAANNSDSGASAISSDYVSSSSSTLAEANSLYSGYKWLTTSLTYKFLTSLPSYYSSSNDEAHNFQTFNAQMKAAAVRVLDQLESFTNLHFTETTSTNSTNQLTFGQASLPSGVGAWAYYPSSSSFGGDVWTNNIYSATTTPTEGNYGFYTLLHEIGHAIGLKHSFTAGLTGDENTSRYTVMAYDWSPFYSSTYMVYDIAALQNMYGANMSWHASDDVYVLNGTKAYTVWDAGGNDTFDASSYSSSVTLDLRDGQHSSVGMTRNIGIAFNAVIENATGGNGNDKLIGNDADNFLLGNGGNDIFIASNGNDTINGGAGTDLVVYDISISNFLISLVDSVTLLLQDLTGAYDSDTLIQIESFEFANTIMSFAALAAVAGPSGGSVELLSKTVFSVYSANRKWVNLTSELEGVEDHAGIDFKLKIADDMLSVARTNNNGHDELHLTIHDGFEGYLQAVKFGDVGDVEELYFNNIFKASIQSATTIHDLLLDIDHTLKSYILTGSGDDLISIATGAEGKTKSAHEIYSGDGDDTISIDGTSTNISVFIKSGSGNDVVTIDTNGSSKLYGEDGNDTLNGASGSDKLYGGNGNDLLYGEDGDDFLSGMNGNDLLHGNNGNDRLYGGNGDDTLNGGSGNDKLYGDDGNDVLAGDDGNDRLYGMNDNDTLTGGNGDDYLNGGNGDDILNGGAGYDVLIGGKGGDTFVFDLNFDAVDVVKDFNVSEDFIDLSDLLSGYDPVTDAISDFLQITTVSKTGYLQVDLDGAGVGSDFVNLAIVNGLKGQDIDDLVNSGTIIVA